MQYSEQVAARAIGQFPISIATSLALEAAAGIHEDFPVARAPILDYQQIWINFRTLYRNAMGALDKETAAVISPPVIAQFITEEMEQIVSIVSEYSKHRTKVVFYYSDYVNLESKYKSATIRQDRTEKQKLYTLSQKQTMDLLLKHHTVKGSEFDVRIFELKITASDKPNALILTHYAYDLLSAKTFSHLMLLESHTGKMKGPSLWYTKYHEGKSLNMIPFREDLIQVFGDAEIFHPMALSVRHEVVEIATKYKWSPVTTTDKIRYGIDQMKNPLAKEVIRSILVH